MRNREMGEQQKVLFVVYRTEWWGCFDSLCRQECSRENILCYVMPIPRYERDRQTLEVDFGKKHFCPESLLNVIPEDAIMVDYTSFSMEQEFDRIYIHNPYDNASPMDSVEIQYYSCNLKGKTKKLIYVPHMLFMERIPEDFIHCPVYSHVDTILLSDERARYSLEVEYDRKVEIVPSGICEYLEKLNAEKGRHVTGSKKRLLYCVSFDDLFYGTEKQIRKMWDIFKYMETRKDIILVFRPDEDIRSRYYQLHTEIIEKYEELVTYFKEKELGILDESPNPYQAAVEADGIMSTGHPMNAMFSVQGKYVLYVDRELRPIPTEEDRCIPSLWATTVVEEEERLELWFVPEKTRLICRMTIPGGQVEIISEVPDERADWLNYVDIVKVGDCLYLAPFQSDGIWKYDLKRNVYSKQFLPGAEYACMTRIIPYGKYLYFIPRNYPGIVKYHIETEEMQILDGWVAELEEMVSEECRKEPYFIWAINQENNMLYMASSKCDAWMEMNLDTDSWKIEKMNLPGRRFIDMVKDGDKVWLLPFCGTDIVLWNCVTKENRLIYTAKELEARNVPYSFAIDMGSTIVALPQRDNYVLLISKTQEGEIKEVMDAIPCGQEDYLSEYLCQRKEGYQFVKQLQNGRILAYEYYDGAFLLLDEKYYIIEKISCRLPIEEVREQQDIIWEKEQCRNEFTGGVHEGYSSPAMIDFFVRQKNGVLQEIRKCSTKYISLYHG